MTNEDDLYRVEGSRVWMSPTALELLQGLGSGIEGNIERAKYLRMRHRIQQAALTSPTAPMGDFSQWMSAPSGPQQEYEATGGEEQAPLPQDDLSPNVLGVTPEGVLPNVGPFE